MEMEDPRLLLSHMKLKQMRMVRKKLVNEEDRDEDFGLISAESSSEEDSADSVCCSSMSSISDAEDGDASSPPLSSPSMVFSTKGPLYDLSTLMSQLPIKRGLSKYYEGKSQSFTSLARVKSTEDLAKRRLHKRHGVRMNSPKPTISKKGTKTASTVSSLGRRRAALLEACSFSAPATGQQNNLLSPCNTNLTFGSFA